MPRLGVHSRARSDSPGCASCGSGIPSHEPRIKVRRAKDTYDAGRILAQYCIRCWPDPGPRSDGRYRRRLGAQP